jgi:hypothetical protein
MKIYILQINCEVWSARCIYIHINGMRCQSNAL